MHPEQTKIYRSMTPAQKLDVSIKLYQSAKAIKTDEKKEQHPNWSKEKVNKKVNEIFYLPEPKLYHMSVSVCVSLRPIFIHYSSFDP